VVHNKFVNVTFIRNGSLKQVQVWSGHGWEGVFSKARNRGEQGDGDREEEDEKWQQREKWLGLTAESIFNSGGGEGHAIVHWIVPKIMDQWPYLP
jgi:hypothetical protein